MTHDHASEPPRPQRKSAAAKRRAVLCADCPPELGPIARAEWLRLVPSLSAHIDLMPFDRIPLAIYCASYQRWIEGIVGLQEYGMMIKTPKGYPIQSPFLAIVQREAETMMKIASEYGFTPTSRAKLFPRSIMELGSLSEF